PLTAAAAALRDKLRRAQALAGGRAQAVADAVRWDRRRISGGEAGAAPSAGIVGGGGGRFLNAPNLVSIGRMVSGPVIGWWVFILCLLSARAVLSLDSLEISLFT